MLDCKFAMTDGIGNMKMLMLIDSSISFSFLSSIVAKYLGWAIKPINTLVAVKIANKTVVHKSWIANCLVSSGV